MIRSVVRLVPSSFAALALVLAACAQPSAGDGAAAADSVDRTARPGANVTLSGDQATDRARIDSLVTIARSLALANGCDEAGGCATAALGVKACGGPKEYLVYCRASTDTGALGAAVELVNRLEREFNERYGIVSDCMLLLEPQVEVRGGACVAGAGAVDGPR